MHKTVRFILSGRVEEISNCQPTRTVLEYLREDKHLSGTKEGCAEGDCGACTVVLGELHNGGIRYRAVNACIQFLPSLDGKQLITVEDLQSVNQQGKTELHSVQQALLDQHGSQCGFCTPGFVMSLFAMYHDQANRDLERSEINSGLAGNLCRCTGYAPIVRAAEQALTEKRADQFTASRDKTIELLKTIQPEASLKLKNEHGRFYAPDSVKELCKLMEKHTDAVLVAGATDVGLWVTKQYRTIQSVIYLGAVRELNQIKNQQGYLSIGAAVTYTDAKQAVTTLYPAFSPLIERIGAKQVRNAGTIGGNIANGSPIGDMPPGLIAVGARLSLRSSRGQRVIDLEDYFIAYGKQDLRSGECVESILLPEPVEHQLFATYKISKRFEQDISTVCAAYAIQIEDGVVIQARVCYGGMAEIPKRGRYCEQELEASLWNQKTIDNAKQALLKDFQPITDMRASAAYRSLISQNLLQRFFLENSDTPYPVRLDEPKLFEITADPVKAND